MKSIEVVGVKGHEGEGRLSVCMHPGYLLFQERRLWPSEASGDERILSLAKMSNTSLACYALVRHLCAQKEDFSSLEKPVLFLVPEQASELYLRYLEEMAPSAFLAYTKQDEGRDSGFFDGVWEKRIREFALPFSEIEYSGEQVFECFSQGLRTLRAIISEEVPIIMNPAASFIPSKYIEEHIGHSPYQELEARVRELGVEEFSSIGEVHRLIKENAELNTKLDAHRIELLGEIAFLYHNVWVVG